jgi:hypothetical protein
VKTTNPDTETARTAIYETFRKYNHGTVGEGCPCCVTKVHRLELVSKPLNELTWVNLNHFAYKTMSTWGGDVDLFKRFLPRILELLDQNPPWDYEIILGKLRDGNFAEWPSQERDAVNSFLLELWSRQLRKRESLSMGGFFCGLVRAGADIPPVLQAWVALVVLIGPSGCGKSTRADSLSPLKSFPPITAAVWFRKTKIISLRPTTPSKFLALKSEPIEPRL